MPICRCGDFVKPIDGVCKKCGTKLSPYIERDRRELEDVRDELFTFRKKGIFNWRLLKEDLIPKVIIDSFITEEFVEEDLWDWIKDKPRSSQMESILSNALKHIQTSEEYDKFEAIVTTHNPNIELQTPSDDLIIQIDSRANNNFRANRELIEKELYPKDLLDQFLEWFILSLEDHKTLRNDENVRQKIARSFLETILQPSYVQNGSIQRLIMSMQRDDNHILMLVSKLMNSDVPHDILKCDENLQVLIERREICRNSILGKWTYLKENFDPFHIIDKLYNSGLVDEDRGEIIRAKPRSEQVYSVLTNIWRRVDRPEMFGKFITILKEENNFIADELQKKTTNNAFGWDKNYDSRELSDSDVIDAQAKLQYYKKDVVNEFVSKDMDTFLEQCILNVDDHELIREAANGRNDMAGCFYETISDVKYIKKGSFDCLVFCLKTNEKSTKARQKLAEVLLQCLESDEETDRTTVTLTAKGGVLYKDNIDILTEGELKLTVHDNEIKDQLENGILEVLESPEYKNKKIDCLQLTIVESSRSSVVLHLRSDGRDVKLLVEKAIVNGDLTRFIGHIVDNKNIKIYMSPERKYEISVSLCSKEENVKNYTDVLTLGREQDHPKLHIIKANRVLLEEEYDPLPLLKAVFYGNARKYKSVEDLSPDYVSYIKEHFHNISKVPERRKRVQQFLNIAEDKIVADILWDFIIDTSNAFSVKKMKDDFHNQYSGSRDKIFSAEDIEKGLFFTGVYEVWKTEDSERLVKHTSKNLYLGAIRPKPVVNIYASQPKDTYDGSESCLREIPPKPVVNIYASQPKDTYDGDESCYITPEWPDEENDPGYINTRDKDAPSNVDDPYYEDVEDADEVYDQLPTITLTEPAESSESLILQLDNGFNNEIRIVLIGKTGAGKSTTGNLLLGKEYFTAATSPVSVTKQCCRGDSTYHDRKIVIVDTPGLFDTELSTEEIHKEIIRCITMSVPGPHIFLILLQVGRLTTEEISTLDQLFDIFGKNMSKFCMIVFTRVEELLRGGSTIDKYILDGGPTLSRYIKKCNGRYFALKNPHQEEDQLKESLRLLEQININISQNKNAYFTNALYKDAKDSLNTSLKITFDNQEKNNRKKLLDIETDCDRKINENRRQRHQLSDALINQNEVKRQLKSKREALLKLGDDGASRDELGKLDQENDECYIRMSNIKKEKEQTENQYEEIKAEKKHLLEARTDDFMKELEKAAAIAIREQTKLMEPHFLKILKKQQEIQDLKTWFESGVHMSTTQMRKSYTDKEKGLQKQKEELEKRLEKKDRSLKHMIRNSMKMEEDFKRAKLKLCLLM